MIRWGFTPARWRLMPLLARCGHARQHAQTDEDCTKSDRHPKELSHPCSLRANTKSRPKPTPLMALYRPMSILRIPQAVWCKRSKQPRSRTVNLRFQFRVPATALAAHGRRCAKGQGQTPDAPFFRGLFFRCVRIRDCIWGVLVKRSHV